MEEYPRADEGELSKMRASLVNTDDLADLALALNLDQELKLSFSEMRARDKGQLKPRLLACVLEALIGAVYVDGGYKKAKKVVQALMGPAIKEGPVNRDYKSILQEFAQKKLQSTPVYNMVELEALSTIRFLLWKCISTSACWAWEQVLTKSVPHSLPLYLL